MEILLQIFRNQKTGKPPLRKLIRQQVTRVWRKWGRTNQQWAAKQHPSSVVGGRNSNRLFILNFIIKSTVGLQLWSDGTAIPHLQPSRAVNCNHIHFKLNAMNETSSIYLKQIQELLKQNRIYYLAVKTIRLIFEIISYLLAILLFVIGFILPLDVFVDNQVLNTSIRLNTIIHIEQISDLMAFMKIILILFSLACLLLGILLGSIRRKNSRMRKATDIIENAINNLS